MVKNNPAVHNLRINKTKMVQAMMQRMYIIKRILVLFVVILFLKECVPLESFILCVAKGEIAMETYVILANYTQKGVASVKESPARLQAVRKAVEAAGGKWLGWYLTMGQYDMVLIVQAPSAQVAASLILSISAQGNVSTQSMRAFSEEEFIGVVASLP
jgi:uncharacterized protein with GYD domain